MVDLDDLKPDEFEIDTIPTPGSNNPPNPFESEMIETTASGRLVLNPKVDSRRKTPLCPECEQEIRRYETPNELVEFRCGCDDLQYFEFPEQPSLPD